MVHRFSHVSVIMQLNRVTHEERDFFYIYMDVDSIITQTWISALHLSF